MITKADNVCKDYLERPGCLKTIDPKFDMVKEDGTETLRWCSFCGAESHKMADLIEEALRSGRMSMSDLEKAIDEQIEKQAKG